MGDDMTTETRPTTVDLHAEIEAVHDATVRSVRHYRELTAMHDAKERKAKRRLTAGKCATCRTKIPKGGSWTYCGPCGIESTKRNKAASRRRLAAERRAA